jgi:hypothetical protein
MKKYKFIELLEEDECVLSTLLSKFNNNKKNLVIFT